jgi:pSer/pThr/pTyr-binding forkhead associated (FHA) protein
LKKHARPKVPELAEESPGALDFPLSPALGSTGPFLPIASSLAAIFLMAAVAGPGIGSLDLGLIALQSFVLWLAWHVCDRHQTRAAHWIAVQADRAAVGRGETAVLALPGPVAAHSATVASTPPRRGTGALHASFLVDGEEFAVKDLALIGRSEDCHICLDDPGLALYQAAIVSREGRLALVNLQSAELTVNGRPVSESPLDPGDVIRLGRTVLHYYKDQAVVEGALTPGARAAGPVVARIEGVDRRLELRRGAYYWIGRNATRCDLALADDAAADRHALLAVDSSGTVTLVDFTSPLGTKINHRRSHFRTLSDGDVLEVGRTWLSFHEDAGATACSPAPRSTRRSLP